VRCFFASDLHGHRHRYEMLLAAIERDRPDAVFLGGDLLPNPRVMLEYPEIRDFIEDFLAARLRILKDEIGDEYPKIYLIMGNDDPRQAEAALDDPRAAELWSYVHLRRAELGGLSVYGYNCVPPTPFQLKDWERYDVSRYVDPGCVSPEEGRRSVPVDPSEARNATIKDDLETLTAGADLADAILLFHSPPHQTALDRAALDGRMIDGVPLDVHVGSIAIRRFIVARQPRLTLHGHIHESASITGSWMERLGATVCLSAAHRGPELALVSFDPTDPAQATRRLL
jgi:uncharacterized protein